MSIPSKLEKLLAISTCFLQQPRLSLGILGQLPSILRLHPELKPVTLSQLADILHNHPELTPSFLRHASYYYRGFNYSQQWESFAATRTSPLIPPNETKAASPNPLKTFFDSRKTGRGIWKWNHYFDVYHRHFSKFIGSAVNILEIGVYSGGSLEMWRDYFGPQCRVYGVDIEEACKSYRNEYTEIIVGDQGDHGFWKTFKERVPAIDILIDDGGHQPEQQIVTLAEMLPHLRPGGVYLCEDVHGSNNGFFSFMQGLVNNLNTCKGADPELGVNPAAFQAWIRSIHFYPYIAVIEKADAPARQFIAPKHGTEWQPFL